MLVQCQMLLLFSELTTLVSWKCHFSSNSLFCHFFAMCYFFLCIQYLWELDFCLDKMCNLISFWPLGHFYLYFLTL